MPKHVCPLSPTHAAQPCLGGLCASTAADYAGQHSSPASRGHCPTHLPSLLLNHPLWEQEPSLSFCVYPVPIQLETWAAMWLLDATVKKKKVTATTNLFARRVSVCKYDLCYVTKVRQTKANLLCENINQSCPGTDFVYKVCNHSGQNECHLLA